MILLITVDEKNQIMQTNVWPTMRWMDPQLSWNPEDYENIRTIRVPPTKVWLPDIVLFNNADGNYEVSFYSNVVVEHTGEMLWVPPAIYKSSCIIDVEYFPFDEQVARVAQSIKNRCCVGVLQKPFQICSMIFGSWTFNRDEVIINYLMGKRQVELHDYSPSGIWDIMEVPGTLIDGKSKIAYQIRIRRKTLFYTVILIVCVCTSALILAAIGAKYFFIEFSIDPHRALIQIPTVLMAFLSMLVFYLPAEADEKITLAISILLALVVFLLLVSKILPPTSSSIPLMAKYLLMVFVLNIITILVTVVIINVYFRGPTTHTMPDWVKTVFLYKLPLLMMMHRPARELNPDKVDGDEQCSEKSASPNVRKRRNGGKTHCRENLVEEHVNVQDNNNNHRMGVLCPTECVGKSSALADRLPIGPLHGSDEMHHPFCQVATRTRKGATQQVAEVGRRYSQPPAQHRLNSRQAEHSRSRQNPGTQLSNLLTGEALKAIDAVEYISQHLQRDNEHKRIREEWKYVSMVIDRLLLYIFFGITAGGTVGILLSAPHVFEYVDQKAVIEQLKRAAGAEATN